MQCKNSFNSLQTGKPIQRGSFSPRKGTKSRSFQFPSNGKAYPKASDRSMHRLSANEPVSIPFKRESLSKGRGNSLIISKRCIPFQFPSNGKAYPKTKNTQRLLTGWRQFQFPSNGKAYPKFQRSVKTSCLGK